MPLTVGDIVSAPHLGLELLARGDLSQPVRWVHATDQPDPAPYLRGGEVVLTDGQPPPPPALIRACLRRRVTLFAVPFEVPFLAISELFVEHVVSESEEPLRRTLRRSE